MAGAVVDGIVLEYDVAGSGELVLLIHGALIADAFGPLLAEPDLINRIQADADTRSACTHCNQCMATIYSHTHCVVTGSPERPGKSPPCGRSPRRRCTIDSSEIFCCANSQAVRVAP